MPRSSVSPIARQNMPADGATSSSSTPTRPALDEPAGEWLAYLPPPLDLDEAERKRQIREILDRGMEEVRAGLGHDWESVKREARQMLRSRAK